MRLEHERRSVGRHGALRTLGGAVAIVLLIGCQTTARHAPTTQPTLPTDSNALLTEYISEQPFVAAEAGYRAVYMLARGEVFTGDFAALRTELHSADIVAPSWNHAPDARLRRSAVGYMICRACGIRTGLNWRFTGLGRYAWRELQYRDIAGPGSDTGLITGGEFLGILARAEGYLYRTGQRTGERAELGAAP